MSPARAEALADVTFKVGMNTFVIEILPSPKKYGNSQDKKNVHSHSPRPYLNLIRLNSPIPPSETSKEKEVLFYFYLFCYYFVIRLQEIRVLVALPTKIF
jgi:hypothetical protein